MEGDYICSMPSPTPTGGGLVRDETYRPPFNERHHSDRPNFSDHVEFGKTLASSCFLNPIGTAIASQVLFPQAHWQPSEVAKDGISQPARSVQTQVAQLKSRRHLQKPTPG